VLRFLRFQAPWAFGGKVFVLLRRAQNGTLGECSLSADGCGGKTVCKRVWNANHEPKSRGGYGKSCYLVRKMRGWRHFCEVRTWRQAGLFQACRRGPSNKRLQATPTALRSFQHNCPPYTFGWSCWLPPAGQGAVGSPETRRYTAAPAMCV
jgi:hypothetical protein